MKLKKQKENIELIKKQLRNILILTVAATILLHSQLYILIYKSFEIKYKKEVKQIIKAGIPQEQLIMLAFHKNIYYKEINNFKWTKKNEFRYKSEMYDIIKTENRNDSVYFYCFHDLKESDLFKNLDFAVYNYLQRNPSKNKEMFSLLTSFNQFYFTEFNNYLNQTKPYKDIIYTFVSNITLEGFILPSNPPPNFA